MYRNTKLYCDRGARQLGERGAQHGGDAQGAVGARGARGTQVGRWARGAWQVREARALGARPRRAAGLWAVHLVPTCF